MIIISKSEDFLTRSSITGSDGLKLGLKEWISKCQQINHQVPKSSPFYLVCSNLNRGFLGAMIYGMMIFLPVYT